MDGRKIKAFDERQLGFGFRGEGDFGGPFFCP
jgi:hypothetical protein